MAILLCLCLLTQCLAHLGIIGYYQLNKTTIAKTRCENRNKPKMKCAGKCYLRKQLNKLDDTETSSGKTPVKTEKSEVLAVFLPPETIKLSQPPPVRVAAAHNPFVLQLQVTLFASAIFHPPSLAV